MSQDQTLNQPFESLSFIQKHPLPFLLIDMDNLRVIDINTTCLNLFQKTSCDLMGTSIFDHVAATDKHKLELQLRKNTDDLDWTEVLHFQVNEEQVIITEVHGWVFPHQGRLVHHLIIIDRTSYYTKQEQLAALAQRYMDFIEQSSEGIYLHEFSPPISINLSDGEFVQELKRKSYITECNDALARMYGYEKAEDIRGLSASMFVNFEDELNIAYLKLFKRNGLRILDTESKEVDRFGKPRYFLNNLVSVVENGQLKRVWGTQRDITEKREIEKRVRLLTSLVEHTSDVLIAIDRDFYPLTWNNAAENIFGLTAQQVIGKSLNWYIDLYYQYASKEEVFATIHGKGEWRGEIFFRRPSDQKLITLFAGFKSLYEDGQLIGYIISASEITQRIEVDKKVRLLANLVKNTSDVLIAVDLNFITISWNEAATIISGIAANQVIGKDVRDFLDLYHHKHDGRNVIDELRETGEWKGEVHFVRPTDNKTITLQSTYKLLKDDTDFPIGYIVSCIDITARKEAEWRLRESEQRFRHLVYDLKVGVLLQDGEGRVLLANQMVLEQFGYKEEEIKGQLVFNIISNAISESGKPIELNTQLWQVLQSKQPVRGVVVGVQVVRSKERKWIMLDLHPIFNEEGALIHIITSFSDITERKKLEDKLRLEEIKHQRQLAQATIDGQEKERREIGKELHDNIGQQLTTIQLYLDAALSTASAPIDEKILVALKGVASLINEVRGISHALMPPTLGDLGLIDAIIDLIETLTRTQKIQISLIKGGSFKESIITDNKKLTLFRIVQEQLTNIIKHAKATSAEISIENKGGFVLLEISDNGIGFDPDKVRKGVGLSNICNRVELFEGSLEIIAAEKRGCVLKVAIPIENSM